MHYEEFRRRFGASVRTKHIRKPSDNGPKMLANKRPYTLPKDTEIEREFIRMEPWEAEYLFRIAERSKIGILETGRLHGGSTLLLSCAAPTVPIWSIDLAPRDDEKLLEIFQSLQIGANVELIVGDSRKTRYPSITGFDVLWVDGDHSYEGCMDDLENWIDLMRPGGHILVHDSYPGQPVMDAVAEFSRRSDVETIVPAFRTSEHWWHPAGSLAHLMKI
ncbi:class I SAM-dependent methyltransferase [Aurantimonas sp. 22II-16-19i]|uniref:class I SAM-dependent methyltransferase n=1 Tax=Aurantimonas sp. 22II-16-19i TaxID=1317114 RepID=UPI0009F7C836|nr:class I SAM-dependent methyltransferase [Aurantimonas sp. 22II-16-19i]ORE94824.1 hypothetical protein ATO4_14229 [Aurantimonas sp. 22II-16-19i]